MEKRQTENGKQFLEITEYQLRIIADTLEQYGHPDYAGMIDSITGMNPRASTYILVAAEDMPFVPWGKK